MNAPTYNIIDETEGDRFKDLSAYALAIQALRSVILGQNIVAFNDHEAKDLDELNATYTKAIQYLENKKYV